MGQVLPQLTRVVASLLTHLVNISGWAWAAAPPHHSSHPDVDLAL